VPRRRLGGRSATVQAGVFEAARALFKVGKPLPTIPQIAKRAQVQKTTLYRRWKNAETIVYEALVAVPTTNIPLPDTGSLRDDLRALAMASTAYLSSDRGRSMSELLLALPPESKQAYWKQRYEGLRGLYDRAAARGEIAPRPDWTVYIDLSAAQFYFYAWAKGEMVTLERRYEVVDVILAALKGEV